MTLANALAVHGGAEHLWYPVQVRRNADGSHDVSDTHRQVTAYGVAWADLTQIGADDTLWVPCQWINAVPVQHTLMEAAQ